MNDYTRNLSWAVFHMIDRSTQDDHRSKVMISALFANPVVAEDSFISNLPNKEVKRYILHVDDLERFEEFYNHIQDMNEEYGDYAIYHIDDDNKFRLDELNKFRSMLGIWCSTKIS